MDVVVHPELAEFRKYLKFFCVRLVQSVVQSRLGHKVATSCKPQGSNCDWFNLSIDELGEVTSELRQATLGKYPPDISCLCVDIQLRTLEGEYLPLEVWAVSIDSVSCDSGVNVRTQLYHSLGILLRSIVAASRTTPTYRQFSRQQSSESFILCYQIYCDPPLTAQLGLGYKTVNIGSLPSPFGQINVDVYYRTKMVIGLESSVFQSAAKNEGLRDEILQKSSGEQRVIPVPKMGNKTQDEDSDPEEYPIGRPVFAVSPDEPCNSVFSTSPSSHEYNAMFYAQDARRSSDSQFDRRHHHSGGSGCDSSCSSLQERHKTSSGNLFNLELSSESDKAVGDPMSTSTWPRGAAPIHMMEMYRQRKPALPFAALLSAACEPEIKPLAGFVPPPSGSVGAGDGGFSASIGGLVDVNAPLDETLTEGNQTAARIDGGGLTVKDLSPQSGQRTPTPTGDDSSDDSFVRVPLAILTDEVTQDDNSPQMLVRQVKQAPTDLKSFKDCPLACSEGQAPADGQIKSQLKLFEDQMKNLDDFVKQMNVHEEED